MNATPAILLTAALLLWAPASPIAAGIGRWTSVGPDGGAVVALAVDPTNPSVVYAASPVGGVFKSTNGGRTWAGASQGMPDYRIAALAIDPQATFTLYAAGISPLFGGAVFVSADAGASWSDTGFTEPVADVSALACDPARSGTVLAASSGKVFRSRDGGRSWKLVDTTELGISTRLTVDPVHGAFFAFSRSGGLGFRLHASTDHGATWKDLSADLPSAPTAVAGQLAVDPRPPGTLYLAYSLFSSDPDRGAPASNALTFRSDDLGRTWRAVGPGGFPIATGLRHVVYAGHYRSADRGETWKPIAVPPEAPLTLAVAGSPNTLIGGVSTLGIVRSVDGGQSWTVSSAGLRASAAAALAIDPSASRKLYAYTSAGFQASHDDGRHWLGAPAFGRCLPFDPCEPDWALLSLEIAVDPSDGATLYLASTAGLQKSTDGGVFFERLQAPDLGCLIIGSFAIDPDSPATLYATGAIAPDCTPGTPATCHAFKSVDGGESWSCLDVDALTLAMAASRPSTLYALGFQERQPLYRSTDGGSRWEVVNPALPGSGLTLLLVAPTDAERLLAADWGGGIWRSTDGGRAWRKILETGFAPWIAVDAFDSDLLYVASSETGVQRSADGGRSWQSLSAGLPPLGSPYTALLADPRHPGTVYLGTNTNGILVYTAP